MGGYIYRQMFGGPGISKRKVQFYIKKHFKTGKVIRSRGRGRGVSSFNWGGVFTLPLGRV